MSPKLTFRILFGLVVLCIGDIQAQKYYHQWPMGYDYHPTEPFGLSILDFNNGKVTIHPKIKTDYGIGENGSFICDRNGNLLMMTNGCAILDRFARVIPEGDSLLKKDFDIYCPDFYPGFTNTLILPSLEDDNYSIVLHKETILDDNFKLYSPKFYLSIVKRQVNGRLSMIKKSKILRDERASYDQITAIPHANDNLWWILEHRWQNTNEFLIYLVSHDSVYLRSVQNIGPELNIENTGSSNFAFSPDGKKLAMINTDRGVVIFDFDRSRGKLSNYRNYFDPSNGHNDTIDLESICYSPNSQYLYITAGLDVYQLDETKQLNPIEHIARTPQIYDDSNWPVFLGQMQIGPDCKIYIDPTSTANYLHVIHSPNRKGANCQVEFKAVRMPVKLLFNLPSMSFYHLGTQTALCDSSIQWITSTYDGDNLLNLGLNVYPNPTHDGHINITSQRPIEGTLRIYDVDGRCVKTVPWAYDHGRIQLDEGPGLYLIQLTDREGKVANQRLVIMND